jgi:hypothetical protein
LVQTFDLAFFETPYDDKRFLILSSSPSQLGGEFHSGTTYTNLQWISFPQN